MPALLPGLCLAGLGAGSLQWRPLGQLETGSAGAVEGGTQRRAATLAPLLFKLARLFCVKNSLESRGEGFGGPFRRHSNDLLSVSLSCPRGEF